MQDDSFSFSTRHAFSPVYLASLFACIVALLQNIIFAYSSTNVRNYKTWHELVYLFVFVFIDQNY